MKPVWYVRTYNKGDENGIFELWKAVHMKSPDVEEWMRWWNWKYLKNPVDTTRMWLADHNGKIVGFYPAIPIKMKIKGEIITGSQIVDLMVHPDYRRQGIFLKLSQKALSELGENGVHISYGFPNAEAYGGHLQSGWFDVCPMQTMIKPMRTKRMLEKYIANRFLLKLSDVIVAMILKSFYRTKKPPKLPGVTIKKIPGFDNSINTFWEKISYDYEILVVRNKQYLTWRYVDQPNADYSIYVAEEDGEICGYVVLGLKEQRDLLFGYIVDIVVPLDKSNVLHHLVSKAIEELKEKNVDLIFCQMISNRRFYKIFKRNGFIYSRNISRRFPFIVHMNSNNFSQEYVKDYKHWFVQQGDSDNV